MRVAFDTTRTKVLFAHSDAREYKRMYTFPGLLKEGMYFYCPVKIQVVHNLVRRLQKANFKITLDKDVHEYLQQPFKLPELPGTFKFHTQPMEYQHISLRYLYAVGSGGLLLDPGMGKSKVVLDYIFLRQFKRSVIICPKALLFVWEDEIAVHRPELTFYTVKSTSWEEEKAGIESAQVVILNYTKAVAFEMELKMSGFDFIHLDEFLIKDYKTQRTKSITNIASRIPYRCGGSGTLINNTVMDVFAPVRYLEPALVGNNAKHFLDAHAVVQMSKVTENSPTSRAQIVAFKGVADARSILESCCIVMTKDKWLKLPEKRFHDHYVPMGEEQKRVYYGLLRNKTVEFEGRWLEADNPLVMLSKLYQVSNGFVYYSEKEEELGNEAGELLAEETPGRRKKKTPRETLWFPESAKVQKLQEVLEGPVAGKRSIIWFNMEAEYTLISQMLDRLGHSYLTVKGGEKDIGGKVRKFNLDPSVQWLVCQAKSVNYGITVLGTTTEKLEDANYEMFPGISPEVHTQVFYSMNFSLEVYLQQQDRIHRLGQKHDCDYHRIFASSPVETKIRQTIGEKMNLRWEMLVDIAEGLLKEDMVDPAVQL